MVVIIARHTNTSAHTVVSLGSFMAKKKSLPLTRESYDNALAQVQSAAEPIDARTLATRLEFPMEIAVKDLILVLEDFVSRGSLIRYPGKTGKGAPRYWDRDLSTLGRNAALAAFKRTDFPITAKDLSSLMDGTLKISEKDLIPILEAAVASGQLHSFPPTTAKGKPKFWDRNLSTMGRDVALAAIKQTALPVTAKDLASQLNGPLKIGELDLVPILETMVANGQLHCFPPATAKGKPKYWDRDLLEYGRQLVLRTLQSKGPLAVAKLQASIKELNKTQFDQILQTLRDAGSIYPHPPVKSGPELLGLRPPAPEAYLKIVQTELIKTVKKLREAHVSTEALRRAIVQTVEAAGISFGVSAQVDKITDSQPVDLVSLMRELEPGASRGALVGARDLRRAAGLSKGAFDQAAFDLAKEGQVSLHRHDYPASLTDSEREELITDGQGQYFVGLALRQSGT